MFDLWQLPSVSPMRKKIEFWLKSNMKCASEKHVPSSGFHEWVLWTSFLPFFIFLPFILSFIHSLCLWGDKMIYWIGQIVNNSGSNYNWPSYNKGNELQICVCFIAQDTTSAWDCKFSLDFKIICLLKIKKKKKLWGAWTSIRPRIFSMIGLKISRYRNKHNNKTSVIKMVVCVEASILNRVQPAYKAQRGNGKYWKSKAPQSGQWLSSNFLNTVRRQEDL